MCQATKLLPLLKPESKGITYLKIMFQEGAVIVVVVAEAAEGSTMMTQTKRKESKLTE